MADDGILLNFKLPSEALAPRQTFRAGSWKERLNAKRASQPNRTAARKGIPRFEETRGEDAELILPGTRPAKRVRLEDGGSLGNTDRHLGLKSRAKINDVSKARNSGVISSLFTFNPRSEVDEVERDAGHDETVEPSNAPVRMSLPLLQT